MIDPCYDMPGRDVLFGRNTPLYAISRNCRSGGPDIIEIRIGTSEPYEPLPDGCFECAYVAFASAQDALDFIYERWEGVHEVILKGNDDPNMLYRFAGSRIDESRR